MLFDKDTLELAARFLDDYITGDKYFKTLYPGHNLVRTRCQLALFADMMRKMEQMQEIVRGIGVCFWSILFYSCIILIYIIKYEQRVSSLVEER